MADEATTPETPATATETKEAVQATVDAASKAELTELKAMVSALTDTVRGALTARATVPANMKPGDLPPHFRAKLREKGLTDADIDHNAPLITPFLVAMLETDGAMIISSVEQNRQEVEMVKASRNKKKYPHWDEVEERVEGLRESAAKEGRYLSVADAYSAAVANDVAAPESRIVAAKERIKAQASKADSADVQDIGPQHGQTRVRRTAATADDVASMSREERKAFFEKIGDTPIR